MTQFAKKKYGQHFLINIPLVEQIASYIIEAARDHQCNVLEIGPGRGVLTKYLAESLGDKLKVVEIDADMIDVLLTENILTADQIIQGDILRQNIDDSFDGEPFIYAGNFPYNISSQIVIKMLENKQKVPSLIGMFQKEMAERIIAPEGNKVYGRLSVLTQAQYTGKRLVKIAPGSFNPPPKVDSLVIRLDRKDKIPAIVEKKIFKTVVASAFGQRRKMMRNTLKSLIQDDALLQNPIFQKRPEQISVAGFVELAEMIYDAIQEQNK